MFIDLMNKIFRKKTSPKAMVEKKSEFIKLRFASYRQFPYGWDGYGANPISMEVIDAAEEVYDLLYETLDIQLMPCAGNDNFVDLYYYSEGDYRWGISITQDEDENLVFDYSWPSEDNYFPFSLNRIYNVIAEKLHGEALL